MGIGRQERLINPLQEEFLGEISSYTSVSFTSLRQSNVEDVDLAIGISCVIVYILVRLILMMLEAILVNRPVLRWAGGKSKLLPKIIPLLPSEWATYHEPMVGGGALFFHLVPEAGVLADINQDLMNFYQILRDYPEDLIRELEKLRPSKDLYYSIRLSKPRAILKRAVRFAYLNRLCWNGLYRVNSEGAFNVPMGNRIPKQMWDLAIIRRASKALQRIELLCTGFEESLSRVKSGDFVFIDPPYPRGVTSGTGFNRYSPGRFAEDDHKRLAKYVQKISKKNGKVMLILAGVDRVQSLYPSSFNRTYIFQRSLMSCNGSTRRKVREVILRNYK